MDGGYAEVMIAEARGIASIPDELSSAEAAPLLCAGITTYNALRNAGLRGGDLVAVQGIGGLGHLGIQFARHMGFHTVAIGRGREKENLAKDLGAHIYIDTSVDDAAAALQRMGGARAILATAPNGGAMGPLVSGLAARGKLIVVGVPQDQIQLNAFPLIFGGRSIYGSLAGTAIDTEDALAFSVLENIRPMIETVPLEQAADALRSHDARQSTVPHGADHKGRTRAKCADQLSTGSLSGFACRGHGRPVSSFDPTCSEGASNVGESTCHEEVSSSGVACYDPIPLRA